MLFSLITSVSVCFRLKANDALKNLKHDFCVHPDGGWPGEGKSLVYWRTCSAERLKLDFFDLSKNVILIVCGT